MLRFAIFFLTMLFALPCAGQSPPVIPLPGQEIQPVQEAKPDVTVQVGTQTVWIDTKARIRIKTPTGEVYLDPNAQPQAVAKPMPGQQATDLLLPNLPGNGPGRSFDQPLNPYTPYPYLGYSPGLPEYPNRLSAYFSSASGGFGFRIGFDRRLSPKVRFTAGPEMLTYGLTRAFDILGDSMPQNITRITLLSLPLGLQRQFVPEKRVIPHVGFAAGPILRFDHRSGLPGLSPFGYGSRIGATTGYPHNSLEIGLPLSLDDFPSMSLTLGGHVSSGLSIRLGEQKDFALTLEGRYTLAHFTDALGSPGDFSGLSLAVGFGKYF